LAGWLQSLPTTAQSAASLATTAATRDWEPDSTQQSQRETLVFGHRPTHRFNERRCLAPNDAVQGRWCSSETATLTLAIAKKDDVVVDDEDNKESILRLGRRRRRQGSIAREQQL